MAYSGRSLSPGSRRIVNPARASDQTVYDPSYHSSRHNSYTAPRTNTTGGVIPISKETFINIPPPRDSRPAERDSYTGRARRSSLVDSHRGSASATTLPIRSTAGRPNVIQSDSGRAVSPPRTTREKEYYIQPASSQEHRGEQHKKLYSIDNGTAKLVADVNIPAERHHRRRESMEHGGHRSTAVERDRGRRGYYVSHGIRMPEKSIDDDDAFSYTDPAGMYRDTEPRHSRPRRGSLDRGGVSRERPLSMADVDPRRSTKDVGPPPSTRGWDKIHRTTRDSAREIGTSPNRSRGYTDGGYLDPRDSFIMPPRTSSTDRRGPTVHQDRPDFYDFDDRRDPRQHARRNSVTRAERTDRSVERRGFGIRSDSRSDSQNRYRSSDESIDRTRYRDSSYEPRRRETAPAEALFNDERRAERHYTDRGVSEDYVRHSERDYRDGDYRRHDHDRAIARDREVDVDREREIERMRQMEPPSERDRERVHRQSELRDRDTGRRDSSPPSSTANLAQAAAGGLAAAAATAGIAGAMNRTDKRDRDDDRDHVKERRQDPRSSADHVTRDAAERERNRDTDRGLGFAFETAPEISKNAPSTTMRDTGREHEGRSTDMPKPAIDPDEEYRRRMEQIQRELGAQSDDHRGSDSDPDRARRRREREQRQRERELGNRDGATAAASAEIQGNGMPTPQQSTRRSDDHYSSLTSNTSTSSEMRRRPSILDKPMTEEPAQIIDNSLSGSRENRVRIVDPPTEEEEKRPRGILKKPTEKFPEDPNSVREGVAPLKDTTKKGIPPGAKWTKIDRRLVNPAALEEAGERYEERLDSVIVLRVLTKEDIQKLADRTKDIREKAYNEDRKARRRDRERRDRDEYSEDDSADEYKKKPAKMLEAPSTTGGSSDEGRDRRRDRDGAGSSYNVPGAY